MILKAGQFRVGKFRKAIPGWVKLQVLLNAAQDEQPWINKVTDARELRMDHRPPLQDRDYDTKKGDFVPPQNDPEYIEAIPTAIHDQRTFGRKAGAEKIVTTRGSDVGEAARTRKIRSTQELHELKLATKRGDPESIARLLRVEKPQRKKAKIPSRPFPKKYRKIA